jgi:iron complex transport system substrate-binding protein
VIALTNIRTPAVAYATAVLVFGIALGGSTAHAQSPAAATSDVARPPYREVIDELGRSVRIPQRVQRIVSLAPSLTETVYALGLQDRLVGDTDYCDYPPDAQKKTKVGGAINPSIEQIVSLRPDLVLVTKSLNRLETVNALSELGFSSYATDPHTVQQIVTSTLRLAEVLGAPDAGATLAADLDRRLADLRDRLNGLAPKRVLFIVWTEPLISVGQNTFIADALRHAGATSVVESSQDWPQMNLEEIVKLQPDFLVLASSHSDAPQNDFDFLANRPGWRGLDAVRNRRFETISDAVNRPSPRIVSAIEDLARRLHPEVFAAQPHDGTRQGGSPPSAKSTPPTNNSAGSDSIMPEACACAL